MTRMTVDFQVFHDTGLCLSNCNATFYISAIIDEFACYDSATNEYFCKYLLLNVEKCNLSIITDGAEKNLSFSQRIACFCGKF